MAVLDKIFFWRHKEEPVSSPGARPELGLPGEDELGLKPPEGLEEPTAAGLAPRGHPIHEAPGAAQYERPDPMSIPAHEPYGAPAAAPQGFAPQPAPSMMSKDLELISSKLDTIKSSLDNLNQRLANLEKMAHGEHETY